MDCILCVTAGSLLSSHSDDDLNQVDEGDNPDDFGGLDSGDEPKQDDIVDEDDPEEDNEDDPANAAEGQDVEKNEDPKSLDATAERHFAEKFLEALGGTEKVLAGNVVGKDLDKLREHSTNGWTEPVYPYVFEHLKTPYEPVDDTNSYPDLCKEPFGPTYETMKCGDSPLALFFSMSNLYIHGYSSTTTNKDNREVHYCCY